MSEFINFNSKNYSVYFGKKDQSVTDCEIKANKPIVFGHQVHGDNLYNPNNLTEINHSQSLLQNCDALHTECKTFALGIYTADCIPCFIVQGDQLYSLHLGWRGVYLKLLSKVLLNLKKEETFNVFLGPHIQSNSFEVQPDLVDKFKLINPHHQNWLLKKESKLFISLQNLLLDEIKPYKKAIVETVNIDTFTDSNFYSYRRDSSQRGRNLSFAFLT